MGIERDEYFLGERVIFDADVLINDVPAPQPPGLTGTTPLLTIAPPPDDDGATNPEVAVTLTITGVHVRGTYDTEVAGWHEWRLATTGNIVSAQQGRFRVLPSNV